MEEYRYIAIDLKSFYASVECVERQLDPLTTHLVVADAGRTDKTICLAVSPSLKAYGIGGRARLFEVERRVRQVNEARRQRLSRGEFAGASCDAAELEKNPALEVSFIIAVPRMAFYIEYSTMIYRIYLKYVAPEDIHVYSIDEVFMDVGSYKNAWHMTAKELAAKIMQEIFQATGITATAGVGTNLYLCKVAMDIMAKRVAPDENGARIAELDEMSYRRLLWDHQPITDFWRVGRGYEKKLHGAGLFTMGDIARCSLGGDRDYHNEELLYRMFGINAELLIDHAWGYEPVTISQIKAYRPKENCICSGQVLHCPYTRDSAELIVREMADQLALDLVEKGLVTDQIVLTGGYDRDSPAQGEEMTEDRYGRSVPKHAHGSTNLGCRTSSGRLIADAVMELYRNIVKPQLLVRRLTLTANHVVDEREADSKDGFEQLELFPDEKDEGQEQRLKKERRLQEAMLAVKKKYGKNAMLKGNSLQEGATARERNSQIGGHRA